jgi:Cellulose binding domain
VRSTSWALAALAAPAALALLAVMPAACAADPGDPLKIVSNASQSGSVSEATSGGDNGSSGDGTPPYQDDDGSGGDAAASSDGAGPSEMPTQDGESQADARPSPGVDAAPANDATVASCLACPIELKYMTTTADAVTADVRPHYEIYNNGSSPQDLAMLTVRYYYTADGSTQQAYACDYAQIGCGSIQATFATIAPAQATADHYIELSFTAGSIPAGGSTGEIQIRFHDSNYQVMFTQTNDYSFNAALTQYSDWNNVTVYRSGALVWGVEPQ